MTANPISQPLKRSLRKSLKQTTFRRQKFVGIAPKFGLRSETARYWRFKKRINELFAWPVTGSLTGFHKCCTALAERIALPMAVWQFDLLFIPRDGPLPVRAQECFDAPAFQSHEASVAQAWLFGRLGEPDEMMDGWFIYGSTEGNRVDVVLDEAMAGEISARVDARSRGTEFVNMICDLSKLLDAKIFSVEIWSVLEASPSAIASAFRCSRAAAYVQDPERFLQTINHAARPSGMT